MECCFTNIKKIVYKTESERGKRGYITNLLETKKNGLNVCYTWQKEVTTKEYFFIYSLLPQECSR